MKKSKFNKLAAAACALLMSVPVVCIPLSACGDKPDDTPPKEEQEAAIVTSITLGTANVKTNFAYREAFSSAGLTVTANMSDGTTESLPLSMCTVSSPDMTVAGVKTVTVSYKNIKATYQITVAERVMPTISSAPLAEINADDVYRIEAEAIDLETPGVTAVEDKELIVTTADESVSGGKYVANYGVEGNYFGFTFTADKEYKNATLVFRAASPVERQLGIGANMNVYLNYKSSKDMGQLNITDVTALPAATPAEGEEGGLVMEWGTRILRGVTIPAGTNTLTFDVLGTDVVCLDYVEIYAGVVYGTNSITELNEVGTVIKDVEDFDLEKIVVRDDVKNAHGLPNGVAFVENAFSNPTGTHGGKAVGAMAKGSEITTALRLKDKATVHILYAAASVDGYKIKDNYEFYMDGELIEGLEDYYIKAGESGKNQWWEWRDTGIGYVDLEAGDHIFTVKVTGKDCNCDCFKFDVLSYGEFIAHPEQSGKISISGLGTYTMEGENIDLFDEKGTQYIKSSNGYYGIVGANNCSAGRYINGFDAETKFIFTVYSFENTTVDIAMRAVRPDVDDGAEVADSVNISLNETPVTVGSGLTLDKTEWKDITLAEGVQLEGGKLYTFTMEVTNPFWLDCISFVTTDYNGAQPTLSSIRLDASAVKKEYEINDTFSNEGLTVLSVMTNDAASAVDLADCQITAPDLTTAGEKTITVEYQGKTATYTVTVYGPVEDITVNADAAKKTYNFGDTFSTDGLVVVADTGAGTTKNIALSDCEVTAPNMYQTGSQTVTVKYGAFEKTYEITVNAVEAHATLNAASGAVTVEAENIDRRGVIQDAGAPTENWSAGGKSGTSLRGVQKGSVLNIYIQAEEDITVNFIAVLSKYEALDVNTMLELTLDGTTSIPVPSLMLGRAPDGSNDWFNWKDVDCGNVELTAGLHVISIKVIGAGPNMDCFKLEVVTGEQTGGEEGGSGEQTGGETGGNEEGGEQTGGENTPVTDPVEGGEQI